MQAGTSHKKRNTGSFESDRFTAGIRAGYENCLTSNIKCDAYGNNIFCTKFDNQQRVVGIDKIDRCFVGYNRGFAVNLT